MRQTVAWSGHLMTVELNIVLATAAASEGGYVSRRVACIDPDHRGAILWQHVLEEQRPWRHSMGTARATAAFRPHCPISVSSLSSLPGPLGRRILSTFAKQTPFLMSRSAPYPNDPIDQRIKSERKMLRDAIRFLS
jgi:hypothetical protein